MSFSPGTNNPADVTSINDIDSQAALYQQYSGMLYGLILSVLKETAAAEGVLERTFARLFNRPDIHGGQLTVLSQAIQQLRLCIREYHDEKQLTGNPFTPKMPYIGDPERLSVADLIVQGYSASEVAVLLNLPVETIRKNLRVEIKSRRSNNA